MARAISAALLAEQKKTAYTPHVSLSIREADIPHPSLLASTASRADEHAIAHASMGAATFIQSRQYIYAATYELQWRLIADPSLPSEWTAAWTAIKTGIYRHALFWTGTYTVLVYINTSTGTAYWRRTSNGGSSWSAEQTIWSASTSVHTLVGVSVGATRSAVFWRDGTNTIKMRRYNHTTDSWGGQRAFTLPSDVTGEFGVATLDAGSDSYYLTVPIKGPSIAQERSIQFYKYNYTTNTLTTIWTHLLLSAEAAGVPYEINSVKLCRADYGWLMVYAVESGGLAGNINWDSDVFISHNITHDDDWFTLNEFEYFSAGMRLGFSTLPYQANVIISNEGCYIVGDDEVFRSPAIAGAKTFNTSRIISYDYSEAQKSSLDLIIDNPAGNTDLDFLEDGYLGANIVFSVGATINGTAYGVDRKLILSDIEWLDYNRQVKITAVGGELLLERWKAYYGYTFNSVTIKAAIRATAALAGIMESSFDTNSLWSLTISLSIQPGQSGRSVLNSLATQFQFQYQIVDLSIHCFVLTASPSVDYTFGNGAGEHPLVDVKSSSRRTLPTATHIAVAGDAVGGEALATTLQAEIGRMFTSVVNRRYITSDNQAEDIAARLLNKTKASVQQGRLVNMPAFHLQVWDVVSYNGFSDDQERYITGIKERYSNAGLSQSLDVGNISQQATGGGGGISMTVDGGLSIVRGQLVSFNSSTFTALVRIEGNASAIELNVGYWNHALTLTTKTNVAVLLFDASNPNDGLILGPYGSGAPPAWPGAGILQID